MWYNDDNEDYDADNYDDGYCTIDSYKYPGIDFGLFYIGFQPMLHQDIADGKRKNSGNGQQDKVFLYKNQENVLDCRSVYFPDSYFFLALLASERHERKDAKDGYEETDDGHKAQQFQQGVFCLQVGVILFLYID